MNPHRQTPQSVALILALMAVLCPAASGADDASAKAGPNSSPYPRFKMDVDYKPYESRKYSKDFKIRGWKVGEDVYMGQTKINGTNGPGIIVDKEDYSWGFNHQGAQFRIPF